MKVLFPVTIANGRDRQADKQIGDRDRDRVVCWLLNVPAKC